MTEQNQTNLRISALEFRSSTDMILGIPVSHPWVVIQLCMLLGEGGL